MSRFLRYVLVIVMVAVFSWLLWVFVTNIGQADAGVRAGLIGFLGVISAALLAHHQTKRREITARLFADKREGYAHVMDLICDLMRGIKGKRELSERESQEKMLLFKKALIVWGGPKAITAWNEIELKLDSNPSSPGEILLEWERVLRAIREDLGHDDSALEVGSLIAVVLAAKDKKTVLGKS